jgi:sulfite exporter TauE/SafE
VIGVEALVPGFVFGLANAAHCAGMCGVFAFQAAGARRRPVRMTLYLLGKTGTYVFLGALAGWLGAQALVATEYAQAALGIAVGLALLVAGVRWILPPTPSGPLGRAWARALAPVLRSAGDAYRIGGPFALGAVTGFLPCGVVYLAALQASAHANPLEAAGSMAAFGMGTVPVLLGVGLLGRGAVARYGAARLRVVGGLAVAAIGLLTLWRAATPLFSDAPASCPACLH